MGLQQHWTQLNHRRQQTQKHRQPLNRIVIRCTVVKNPNQSENRRVFFNRSPFKRRHRFIQFQRSPHLSCCEHFRSLFVPLRCISTSVSSRRQSWPIRRAHSYLGAGSANQCCCNYKLATSWKFSYLLIYCDADPKCFLASVIRWRHFSLSFRTSAHLCNKILHACT